jgi:hypothetical protein
LESGVYYSGECWALKGTCRGSIHESWDGKMGLGLRHAYILRRRSTSRSQRHTTLRLLRFPSKHHAPIKQATRNTQPPKSHRHTDTPNHLYRHGPPTSSQTTAPSPRMFGPAFPDELRGRHLAKNIVRRHSEAKARTCTKRGPRMRPKDKSIHIKRMKVRVEY